MNYLKNIKLSTKTWKKVILIIAIVSAISYLAFMGAYFATSEPSFCTLCHAVKPYVDSWRRSSHKSVKCLYCHEQRGFIGKVESKTRGVNFVYQHLTGQYTIFTQAKIFEQNCIACHLGDYWNYPETKRLNLKHYEFIRQDKPCLQCHRETGHKVNSFSSAKFKKHLRISALDLDLRGG